MNNIKPIYITYIIHRWLFWPNIHTTNIDIVLHMEKYLIEFKPNDSIITISNNRNTILKCVFDINSNASTTPSGSTILIFSVEIMAHITINVNITVTICPGFKQKHYVIICNYIYKVQTVFIRISNPMYVPQPSTFRSPPSNPYLLSSFCVFPSM